MRGSGGHASRQTDLESMETRGKIYLATPDAALARNLRSALEGGGYRLQEAMDWSMIAEEVGLFGANLVLMSRRMPGCDALESLHSLKTDPRTSHCAVLILLPEFDAAEIDACLSHGADDVLHGAIVPADLLNRIGLHIRSRTPDSIDIPDLMLSMADETVLTQEMDPVRPVRGIPDGLPMGLDHFYEADLSTLIEVSEAMASSLPVSDALYVAVRRVAHTVPVSRCNVVVRGSRDSEVVVMASHDDPNLRNHTLDLHKYPEIRRCLDSGDTVLIEDVHADPDMREVLVFIQSVDLRSCLVLPLCVKEVVVGTMSLTTRRVSHGFTRREILFLRALANMVAGVLATTDVIERLRRRNASEKSPMEDLDEIVLGLDDQIDSLIEELERK